MWLHIQGISTVLGLGTNLRSELSTLKQGKNFDISICQPTHSFFSGTAGKCAFGSNSMVLAQQSSDTFQLTHARCTQ